MRALRVDKLTLAVLSSVIRSYFNDQTLVENIPLFAMLEQSEETLRRKAESLARELKAHNLVGKIVESTGQCGGGTLPNLRIKSFAVTVVSGNPKQKGQSLFAEKLFNKLHKLEKPIIAILKEGDIFFDVLTISKSDIPYIAEKISEAVGE